VFVRITLQVKGCFYSDEIVHTCRFSRASGFECSAAGKRSFGKVGDWGVDLLFVGR